MIGIWASISNRYGLRTWACVPLLVGSAWPIALNCNRNRLVRDFGGIPELALIPDVSSMVARIGREASEIRDWRGTSSRAGELGGRR